MFGNLLRLQTRHMKNATAFELMVRFRSFFVHTTKLTFCPWSEVICEKFNAQGQEEMRFRFDTLKYFYLF